MEPVIRLTRPDDINILCHLDLRSYQYPLPMQDWQAFAKIVVDGPNEGIICRIIVVEVLHKPIGFAVWSIQEDEKTTFLYRLGVLPEYRLQNMGTLLMATCKKHSQLLKSTEIQTLVPHIHCIPGDPDDVSQFLQKTGFTATGVVKQDYKTMYGELVDGYYFRSPINATL